MSESVGRIALMEDGEARDEALVLQVGIELGQVLGQEHSLVDHRTAGQRADVEIDDGGGQHRPLDAAADNIKLAFELAVLDAQAVGDKHLLDFGARGIGLLADNEISTGTWRQP